MNPFQIQADEASQAQQDGSGLILDVREPNEWAAARIPGATHIPLHDLPQRFEELPRDRLIVCQCASGVRSHHAAGFLAQQGFQTANLEGGIIAWHRSGLPLEQ